MRKFLTIVLVLGFAMISAVGCRAEGELGDASTSVASPR